VSERKAVTITLELTPPQAAAIEDMLYQWNYMGGIGRSRWTAFYADGDGNFQPNARIDGRKPEKASPTGKWHRHTVEKESRPDGDGVYFMDFDGIAWAMREAEGL